MNVPENLFHFSEDLQKYRKKEMKNESLTRKLVVPDHVFTQLTEHNKPINSIKWNCVYGLDFKKKDIL